jgi:hypothetical protein
VQIQNVLTEDGTAVVGGLYNTIMIDLNERLSLPLHQLYRLFSLRVGHVQTPSNLSFFFFLG